MKVILILVQLPGVLCADRSMPVYTFYYEQGYHELAVYVNLIYDIPILISYLKIAIKYFTRETQIRAHELNSMLV